MARTQQQDILWIERFFSVVQSSVLAQQTADLSHHVPWNSHLSSCLRSILWADWLIGPRAVVFNPHFQRFFSSEAIDLELGGVQFWPAVPALLLLDSFVPTEQVQILAQATAHCSVVWVLRQDQQSVTAASDLISLSSFQSTWQA